MRSLGIERKAVALLFLAALAFAPLPRATYAQRAAYTPKYDRFYASVAVGVAEFEDEYLGLGYGDSVWTAEAAAGYRFDWLWSVEAALHAFGDIGDRGVPGSGTERLDFASDLDAASLRLRLWFPVSELYSLRAGLDLFGFVGVQASFLERAALETTSSAAFGEEETNYGMTVGGGLSYLVGPVNLRGSLTWTDLNSVDGGEVLTSTLGVEFRF